MDSILNEPLAEAFRSLRVKEINKSVYVCLCVIVKVENDSISVKRAEGVIVPDLICKTGCGIKILLVESHDGLFKSIYPA